MSSSTSPAPMSPLPTSPIDELQEKQFVPAHSTTDAVPQLGYGVRHTRPPQMDKRQRYMFYLRLVAFFVLEVGFIVLASLCLTKPIPLHIPLRLDDADVKGGFTVIFIIWHTLALVAAGHFLADAFSREWSVQLVMLEPGTTDKVSTVTSGVLDRIAYFFNKRASGTFKLAFFASLTLTMLMQLAPGTISAATTLIDIPIDIQIGNLSSQLNEPEDVRNFLTTGSRADLITRLEQVEHSSFGFHVQPSWMVAWPSLSLADLNGTVDYSTDVVEFHHSCHWEAPRLINAADRILIQAAGEFWATGIVFGENPGSSISAISLADFNVAKNTSTSAFLFLGGNNTYRNTRTSTFSFFAIDLGTLPTLFSPTGIGIQVGNAAIVAPLASVLVCDPQFHLSGGRVRLSAGGSLEVLSSGHPLMGNIPLESVNLIFSNALGVSVQNLEILESVNIINTVSGSLFMNSSSVDWQLAQNIPPLDLESINQNMDRFALSAVKAFSDGYHKDESSAIPSFSLTPISAVGQEQRLALTTTRGLLITVVILVAISLILLSVLCQLAIIQKRFTFDLDSVLHVLRDQVKT